MSAFSRRELMKLSSAGVALASLGSGLAVREAGAQPTGPGVRLDPYPSSWLPDGVRSRFVENVNGLRVHVLEAGNRDQPGLLLLHGFHVAAGVQQRLRGNTQRLLPSLLLSPFFGLKKSKRRINGRLAPFVILIILVIVTIVVVSITISTTLLVLFGSAGGGGGGG